MINIRDLEGRHMMKLADRWVPVERNKMFPKLAQRCLFAYLEIEDEAFRHGFIVRQGSEDLLQTSSLSAAIRMFNA